MAAVKKTRKKKSDIEIVGVEIVRQGGMISRAFGMLSKQLLAFAEDPTKWAEVSEKIRLELLAKLNAKKPPKQLRDRKKK